MRLARQYRPPHEAIAHGDKPVTYKITANKVVEIEGVVQDPTALEIRFGGHTSAGIKAHNQDAFAAYQPDSSARMLKGVVVAIADGVSCSERSAEASQVSVTDFINDYYSTPDTWTVKESAARVLNALNDWLYQQGIQGKSLRSELVTTFSGIVFKSNTAHIFQVGDSRIYRCRGGNLEQLTRSHSRTEAGDKAILTHAMGMDIHLEVDYLSDELEAQDLYLLTTDGVHDFLSDDELKLLLHRDSDSLESLAQLIVNNALNQGSDDNLSCLIVRVVHLPDEDIDEAHRKLAHYVVPPVMEPGMSIDGYRILEVLHSSSRSHLYLVQGEGNTNRLVLKAPSRNFSEDDQHLEAFIREQWIGRRINHPNVMSVHRRPDHTRFLYNLYEYLPARNLRQWMHDNPRPALGRVRNIIEQIAAALRAFQRLSMVHRDLKPENVLIDKDDRIKLIDFGTVQVRGLEEIRTALHETCPVGSMHYIAPEYLMSEQGLSRSDIFSLGVIAYEMLCDCLPYKGLLYKNQVPSNYGHWQYQSISDKRDDLPPRVDLALKRATAPAPKDRYQALSEFLTDLRVPNQQLSTRVTHVTLMERNPLLFWQTLCAILFALLLWQLAV